jgi:hypothetical protein
MGQLIRFSCNSCGKTLKAKSELVGKKARCSCGQIVKIPGPTLAAPSAGAPLVSDPHQAAAKEVVSSSKPRECYYCGGEAANHVTAFLFPTTEEAKEAAAEEYQRKESGAPDCKKIYVREKSAGYGQLVEIPRCKPCGSAHGLPWKIALLGALLALPLTIYLSSEGYWPSPRSLASSFAEPVDLGEAGKVMVQINQTAGTREGKMVSSVDDKGMVQPSIYFVLLMTAMVFLLPVIAVGFIVYGSVMVIQRVRLHRRNIKWKSDVKDYPLVKEQVSQGWSFQGTL